MMSTRTSVRWKRILRLVAAPAALLVVGTMVVAPASQAATDGVLATFTDDFNGAAGSGVDGSKWVHETGDNVNNHERQWYTGGNANAVLDGQGHLVITAKKENPANYNCWYGRCQ